MAEINQTNVAKRFANRTARVLIVEPVGPFRDVLRRTLVALGFQDVHSIGLLKDAVGFMETEGVADWIVCGGLGDGEPGLHGFLAMILGHQILRETRVSVFYRDAEVQQVKTGFELGLMSCHPQNEKTIASAENELKALLHLLTKCNFDTLITAAHYLRNLLKKSEDAAGLLRLERELLNIYPRSAYQMLNLAEAYFLSNMPEQGRSSLAQAKYANPAVGERADALFEKHLGNARIEGDRYNLANVFQLKSCLVVDPDQTVHVGIVDAMKTIGVNTIECVNDGNSGYSWLKANGEPGLIIMEWKLPGLPGSALLQRIRDLGFHNVPVLIQTGSIKPMQRNLIREMGAAGVAVKPFGREEFLKILVTSLRASYFPTHFRTIERKIIALLGQGRIEEARSLKDSLLAAKDAIPVEARKHLLAKFAYADGDFKTAHHLATELVQEDPDNLGYQDLLGKVLMKLGEFEAAVMCFERARSMAPENVERICSIADALAELGEYERANATVDDARKVDDASSHVLTSDAKIGLVTGDVERARTALSTLESNSSVMAYLNNRAVAYARTGRFQSALKLYSDALRAIPDGQRGVRTIVTYNLGLAHIRAGDVAQAGKVMEEADRTAELPFKKRTSSLLGKIKNAISTGAPLLLDSGEDEVKSLEQKTGESADSPAGVVTAASISVRPGEVCCYAVFRQPDNAEVAAALKAAPPFKRRSAISRGDTRKGTGGYSGKAS